MADRSLWRKCPKCGFLNIHRIRYNSCALGAVAPVDGSIDREWLEITCDMCEFETKIPCYDQKEAS